MNLSQIKLKPHPLILTQSKALGSASRSTNGSCLQQQLIPDKPKRQLVVDVHGRTTLPVCTYHGCDHMFSDHGFGGCRCKHPPKSNKVLGVFNEYL